MENFKGTKGNWRCTADHSEITVSEPGLLTGSEGIADVNFFGKEQEEVQANAMLLGASKDLLEAILAILPHAELIINTNHPDHEKARLAIGKALGRIGNE